MRIAPLGLALFAGSLLVAAVTGLSVTNAAGSVVSLDASDRNITVDQTVSLEILATDLSNLAAYEVKIEYDSDVLEFVGFQDSGWLATTGRQVTCPPPLAIDDNTSDSTKAVLVGCGSLTFTPEGPVGDAGLATLTFKGVGEGTSSVLFRKIELADPNGESCCSLSGVDDTSVRVSSNGNDADVPPKPRADITRLTPTPPPGATATDTYRLDPSLPSVEGNSSGQSGPSRTGRSGSVARADTDGNGSADATSGSDGFPVAGSGPQSSSGSRLNVGWIALGGLSGLVLVGAGLVNGKQSKR